MLTKLQLVFLANSHVIGSVRISPHIICMLKVKVSNFFNFLKFIWIYIKSKFISYFLTCRLIEIDIVLIFFVERGSVGAFIIFVNFKVES